MNVPIMGKLFKKEGLIQIDFNRLGHTDDYTGCPITEASFNNWRWWRSKYMNPATNVLV